MTDYVFLGPSLPRKTALVLHPAAVLLDPVAMGDLFLLVHHRARRGDRIAIIDGLFEQLPAVWHKEILFALEQGIEVHGAASMGALRAAELDSLGMVGHGRVYQAYRDGLIEDDDEVAVAHATGEQGFRSLSDAMASIRLGLTDMQRAGLCDDAQCTDLITIAKATHYSRRSWADLARHAKTAGWSAGLCAALRQAGKVRDLKGQDAEQLLCYLAETPVSGLTRVPVRLQRTTFWQGLIAQSLERAGPAAAEGDTGQAQLAAQVLAADEKRDTILLLARSLLSAAATADAELADWELLDASLTLVRLHGLANSEQLRSWRQQQGLANEQAWRSFLSRFALTRRSLPGSQHEKNRAIADALRVLGSWDVAEQRRLDIESQFSQSYYKSLSLHDVDLTPEAAESLYRKRLGPMLPGPAAHAERLGFETLRDLLANLAAVAGSEAAASSRPAVN
jgi:hypothetical protein